MQLKKCWKRFFVIVLMFCVMIPQTVFAQNESTQNLPQEETTLWVEIQQNPAELVPEASEYVLYTPQSVGTEWGKYSTAYYYNKMDSRKQELYDEMDALCYSYLTGTADGIEVSGYGSGMLPYITYQKYGLTDKEASNVLLIFRFSNPQYYFINEYYWVGNGNIALGMYTDVLDGDIRSTCTTNLKNKIDLWVNEINQLQYDGDKEKRAHDLVVQNGSYDYTGTTAPYNQSCYSIFMNEGGQTVCAGYAQAFALLCNAVGLDTICVTSSSHEWNLIKLNGTWYHVDCTWNDTSNTNTYYNLTTEQILSLDQGRAHEEEVSIWLGYLPDYDKAPQINATFYNGYTNIVITSAKSGGTIYYTLDGSQPTTASEVYTGEITIGTAKTIKAVTVYNGIASSVSAQSVGVNNPVSNTKYVVNGVDYSSVFDAPYYLGKYADLQKAFGNDYNAALNHFISNGMYEGRQAIATFDVNSYKRQYVDLRTAFGNDLKSYYLHYISYGKKEGRAGTGCTTLQGAVTIYNGVNYASVYDYNYYINAYADIKKAYGNDDIAVLEHFVNCGMREGRQAKSSFSVDSYRKQYVDLRRAYGNDLKSYYLHYINYGERERRAGTGCTTLQGAVTIYNGVNYASVYDYNYYINAHADIKKAYGNDDVAVLEHFVNCGMREGRQAIATFDVNSYKRQYVDLRTAFGNDLKSYYLHYISYGKKEGRAGTGCTTLQGAVTIYNGVNYASVYDYNYYINAYADIKKAYGDDDIAVLEHFVNCGMREGRQAKSSFNVNNYRNRYVDLQRAYGNDLKSYYLHFINFGIKEGRLGA